MLVYGDRSERIDAAAALAALEDRLARSAPLPAGLARHSALVAAFIETGRIVQGLADLGDPHSGPIEDFLFALARTVCRSWDLGFVSGPIPKLSDFLAPSEATLPEIVLKVPEGYAFYALYPEAYVDAARALKLEGSVRVIGIRSIGTGLAALVAAALDAPRPISVRPSGDPFDRRLSDAPGLDADWRSDPGASYVIVDEGPGLSGSSFGAVADWLEAQGVGEGRIAFLPSHGGDLGPMASPAHRARWSRARRIAADLGPSLPARLADWAGDLLGPLDAPLLDLSGGAWRNRVWRDEADWPACHVQQERLKFLARARGENWLLKFAGLGREGERKMARARILHAAGLVPEPLGLVHGFLAERWHDAPPVGVSPDPAARVPLDHVARYLGARARLLPAGPEGGAGLSELMVMARRNTGLALGADAASRLDRWDGQLPRLAALVRPIDTDNRLDPHEWIRLPGGGWLKADALDHSTDHDLIGCQDLAWDIAGAAVEFDLDDPATAAFAARIARAAGRPIDPELLAFLEIAYLAYRLGRAILAAQSLAGWPAEAKRLEASAARYAERLNRRLNRRQG